LRNRRLDGFKFRRQHAIGRFVVDFYCGEANLVIEVDGPVHRGQAVVDAERQREIEARGLRVIRFHNDEVLDETAVVLERIAAHLTPNPSPKSERGTQRL
jgi:very-short-patch-repair endonuclease